MSFGLHNATQTFQRVMDGVLKGFDFCFVYLDDILVFSGHSRSTNNTKELPSPNSRRTSSSSARRNVSSEQPRSPSSVTRCPPRALNLWKRE
jgi:hypothetical protein